RLVGRREAEPQVALLLPEREAREERLADEVAPPPEHRCDAYGLPRAEGFRSSAARRPRRRGPGCAGACARGPSHGSGARLWPDLRIGEPGALARRAELGVVVGPERLHVLRDDKAPVGRLVLQLVHRHVLVAILALERLVAPRAHEAFEL